MTSGVLKSTRSELSWPHDLGNARQENSCTEVESLLSECLGLDQGVYEGTDLISLGSCFCKDFVRQGSVRKTIRSAESVFN